MRAEKTRFFGHNFTKNYWKDFRKNSPKFGKILKICPPLEKTPNPPLHNFIPSSGNP